MINQSDVKSEEGMVIFQELGKIIKLEEQK